MKLSDYIDPSWWVKLQPFFASPVWKSTQEELARELDAGKIITPEVQNIFRAFRECTFDNFTTLMLGQDPYPGKNIADGLAFSARTCVTQPKSLQFIAEAIEKECYGGFDANMHALLDLTPWANQGVLLLNAALTTVEGKTAVHYALWQPFITYVLDVINMYKNGSICIFFGNKAQEFERLINGQYHYKMYASHPASAAYSGNVWESNGVFKKTNEVLKKNNNLQIEWNHIIHP